MNIKYMREKTGLTQKSFAEFYHIPLQTLKQWESNPGSTSYRKPPFYVYHMLEKLVRQDFDVRIGPLNRVENLIFAAEHSRGNAQQWLRYLRKEFEGSALRLNRNEVKEVLDSDKLSAVQKIIFKRTVQQDTATNKYVIALNDTADTPMVDELKRRRHL
ncbi:MAG TPA: helix-turn-helix domain-containing protein [Mogibacterium sp.]|nr:helix-turn-helix domain-containing protein [Mogibacterium sp.]